MRFSCYNLRFYFSITIIDFEAFNRNGPSNSSGKRLGYGLDDPGSITGVGEVEIFLHSLVSRLVLGSTQPPINEYGRFLRGKGGQV